MEPLSWTGALGTILDPILYIVGPAFLALLVLRALVAGVMAAPTMRTNPDGTLSAVSGGLPVLIPRLSNWVSLALGLLVVAYLLAGAIMGAHGAGIIGGISQQLVPVWLSLIALFIASFTFKRRLGLYGKLFDSTIGMVGFALVMFWVFTGIYAGLDMLVTHDPLSQVSGMKNKGPGTPLRGAAPKDFQWYLLGGDNLARDVFSR
ncbi:MAG: ABC transporter permease, partial [Lutimaribacter sp.]